MRVQAQSVAAKEQELLEVLGKITGGGLRELAHLHKDVKHRGRISEMAQLVIKLADSCQGSSRRGVCSTEVAEILNKHKLKQVLLKITPQKIPRSEASYILEALKNWPRFG